MKVLWQTRKLTDGNTIIEAICKYGKLSCMIHRYTFDDPCFNFMVAHRIFDMQLEIGLMMVRGHTWNYEIT